MSASHANYAFSKQGFASHSLRRQDDFCKVQHVQPIPTKCLESWSEELVSRADRVRQLIGNKHWLTDGRHKEHILKEFLVRHLPPTLSVGSGFICPPDPNRPSSREIDILISDSHRNPPWFAEGGTTLVPPEAVVAHIHVKSKFGTVEIDDVFDGIAAAYRSMETYCDTKHVWSAGFFYQLSDSSISPEKALDWCEAAVARVSDKRMNHLLPACLTILGSYTILLQREADKPANLRLFKEKFLSPAIILTELSSHMAAMPAPDYNRTGIFSLLQLANVECVATRSCQEFTP